MHPACNTQIQILTGGSKSCPTSAEGTVSQLALTSKVEDYLTSPFLQVCPQLRPVTMSKLSDSIGSSLEAISHPHLPVVLVLWHLAHWQLTTYWDGMWGQFHVWYNEIPLSCVTSSAGLPLGPPKDEEKVICGTPSVHREHSNLPVLADQTRTWPSLPTTCNNKIHIYTLKLSTDHCRPSLEIDLHM